MSAPGESGMSTFSRACGSPRNGVSATSRSCPAKNAGASWPVERLVGFAKHEQPRVARRRRAPRTSVSGGRKAKPPGSSVATVDRRPPRHDVDEPLIVGRCRPAPRPSASSADQGTARSAAPIAAEMSTWTVQPVQPGSDARHVAIGRDQRVGRVDDVAGEAEARVHDGVSRRPNGGAREAGRASKTVMPRTSVRRTRARNRRPTYGETACR